MAKKKSNDRVEFNLSNFFNKKLELKDNKLYFGTNIRLNELTELLNIEKREILKTLGLNKLEFDHILDSDQIAEICLSKNIDFEKIDDISEENILSKIDDLLINKDWKEEVEFVKRTPIITIMGHVDHGKTTLLDTIRNSNVTKGEAGGITQKIGAYQIKYKDELMTFIDTPGHEAFTEMRANGSKVTDIAVIVVAADDSLMPQTRESIDHAKAANVPIVVAVNKVDKPNVDVEKVKQELTQLNIVPEEWGGDVPFIEISALKGTNIDKLLDSIVILSDLQEIKVPLNTLATGVVIESNISKTKGNIVSVIVTTGTLKTSDTIIIDDQVVRIKALIDENGKRIDQATPGTPVELFGIGFSPVVGSKFVVVKDKSAQKIADTIREAKLNSLRMRKAVSAHDLFNQMLNKKKEMNIILKADSLGVLKAIELKIKEFSTDEVEVNVIRSEIGEITNTDISLAEASNAIIYQFNVPTPSQLEKQLKSRGIQFLNFDIIYKIFEDIQEKIEGKHEDKFEESKIGDGKVLVRFEFSKVGAIAGSRILNGEIRSDSIVKVYRNGKLLIETKVDSLKVERDNVKKVTKGKECGIVFVGFNDFQEEDTFEIFELVKI